MATRPEVELRVGESLDCRQAPSLCRRVREALVPGLQRAWLNLEDVKATDVVGLAALRQAVAFAQRRRVALSVLPSPAVYRAALQAGILDELPVAPPGAGPVLPAGADDPEPFPAASDARFLARSARVGIRPPAWEELPTFERWAGEPLLEQMVGSELLYLCRHLGAFNPDFVARTLHDPCALTVLVEPADGEGDPMGFVRLFGVHLAEGFGFIETAIADPRALRRGFGVEASRLTLAYAMDTVGIRRVEAKVYAYNVLSINALRRNGFQQEGALREARTYDGLRWDILVFGLLEDGMRRQRAGEFGPMGFWPPDAAP